MNPALYGADARLVRQAHAETNLVAAALARLRPDEIARSVLYTSCEPCAMCVGKMYWAGVRVDEARAVHVGYWMAE